MRKIIVISGIVLLIAAAAYLGFKYLYISPDQPVIQTFSTKQNPAFKAVPQKSPLIIEVKNQEGFFNAFKAENPALAEFKGIPQFENIYSNIGRFRDFVSSHSGIGNLLKSKSIIISVNPTGKNQLSNLFLVQLNDQNESNSAMEVVSQELGTSYSITRRNYENTTIINAKSEDLSFYFTVASDIFIASEDFILIEDAIRHTNSQNLLNNREFKEAYKTIEETALANIFINHATIQQVLSKLVSPEIRKSIGQIASYSNWTELDFWAKTNGIELDGYSVTKDSTDTYLNIFRNQEAKEMTIENAIPFNTSYFVALNLKNTSIYIDQYENYLKAKGDFYPRERSLIEFRKKTNTDAVKLIKEIAGSQVAAVYTTINKTNPRQNRFFIAELTDRSDAKEKLSRAVSEFSRTSKITESKLITDFTTTGKKKFSIYRLPIESMGESIFGQAFSGINAEYVVLLENYLVCGDNLPGMKSYIQNITSEKTLANDSAYQVYKENRPDNPNFYLYTKIPKIFRLKDILLKSDASLMLSENEDIIRKYSTFSWQFSVSDKMIKNRISLKYDPNAKEEPEAIWLLKLDDQLAQKPKFVINHKDLPNKEVIVCDSHNNVSLVNKEGLVLWTMKIPGEIVSEIQQIDIYRTNRFQYIFNTKTQLYVVDRLGNNVGKYPVTLKSIASNGVSVAEYGKNKEYRFFIAGEDKQIYVFDRDGRLIPNWKFEGSDGLVTSPIRHYDIDGKDFIVFSDARNTYFLDRQGKNRELQPSEFSHSDNPLYYTNNGTPKLITTDETGKIHLIDFTGEAEIKEVGEFGTGHRFVAEDLDGDGSPDYIFADGKKLIAFSSNGSKLFERSFPGLISKTPNVFLTDSGNIKIGVVVSSENKVYLLNKNGSDVYGFPVEGNTDFVLGKFNDSNSWFNLVVGGLGNTLINYRIH